MSNAMRKIHFYTRALPTCQLCKRPATKEILGNFNSSYGHVCDRCEKKKLAALDRAHNAP